MIRKLEELSDHWLFFAEHGFSSLFAHYAFTFGWAHEVKRKKVGGRNKSINNSTLLEAEWISRLWCTFSRNCMPGGWLVPARFKGQSPGFQTIHADLTEMWVISPVLIVAHIIGFGKIQGPIHFVELRPSSLSLSLVLNGHNTPKICAVWSLRFCNILSIDSYLCATNRNERE